MNRAEILQTADKYVSNDREAQYGSPEENFTVVGDLWNTYLGSRISQGIDAEDVAVMLSLLKIARIASGQTKDDNYIDACGYLALAGEIATK
jgi:hypothetical protein